MGPQTSIAHYRLGSKLGEGGMGTVWRATDTRLRREVAIKILPDDFAADADRLARFAREAQVLASLNHPNIAAIYGVEDRALILELVEGPTLAERIAQGPIPLDEALPLLQQLADALEYAHDKGVVHRDLKPANLKVTPDGRLKVLDFGLAKAFTPDTAAPDPRSSPTLTMRATMAGAIMGTAAYMAPEQARGHNVDKRADIWAFGVVAWEMLAGRLLFDAPTVSDTLALVLTKDPDLTAVPVAVRPLLARCLERDPRKRLRDIGDALPLIATAAPAEPRSRPPLFLGALAAIGILAAIAVSFVHFREASPPAPAPVRFEITAPPGAALAPALALSPDGRSLAFVAQMLNRPRQIWVRALDSVEYRPLPAAEASLNSALIWSPDARFLMYFIAGQIRKVEVSAGTVQTLCAACPTPLGGAWNGDGVVLYTTSFSGLTRSGVGGEAPAPVAGGASVRGNVSFLRDGRRFLYTREGKGIYLGSLGQPLRDGDSPLLPNADSRFAYVPSPAGPDYLLFLRSAGLLAQRVNRDRLTLIGEPVLIASDVASFTASNNGILAYRAGSAAAVGTRLVWYDRSGKPGAMLGAAVNYNGVTAITRDGKTAFVDRAEQDGSFRVWMADLARGVFSRLSAVDRAEAAPVPLPDGRVAITYASSAGGSDIYAIGPGAPEALVKSTTVKHSNDISPDGRWLIYDDHNGTARQDLWVVAVPASGAPPPQPVPFLATPADETFGQFSPDGRWVAYSSDETGRREIYVREFLPNASPAAGARKWLVSTGGGDKPRWAHNGKEIYFLSHTGKMMAAPVKTSPVFDPGIPVPLFDVIVAGFSPYAVTPDGRFLINTVAQSGNEPAAPITVVVNWTAGLK